MKEIKNIITAAIKKAGYSLPEDFVLELPPKEVDFDLATNVAFIIAGKIKKNPQEIAEEITENLKSEEIKEASVAGGYINLKLSANYYQEKLKEILKKGANFGKLDIGKGQKILLEFISANPTGPLHIGNARGGPIGETLSNVMSWLGFKVSREFYVNDGGNQIKKFGRTLAYYYIVKNDPNYHFPEDGYPGDFLKNISEEIQKDHKAEIEKLKDNELVDFFIRFGLDLTMRRIKEDVELLGIHFDKFAYESDFLNSGASAKIVEELREKGKTSEKEGAIWFSSKKNADESDQDNVLVRSDAEKSLTYFASDIAYHKDKFDRGYKKLIDIWGPNHHGHIARLKAAMQALGYSPEKLQIFLYQNVKLKQGGIVKQMGKRLGNFVNIADLVSKMNVPTDVFKYMIISQSPSSTIDFDLDLALEQSEKNPLYYIQYAYARLCSILGNADTKLVEEAEKIARGEVIADLETLKLLTDKKELFLVKRLLELPETLNSIASDFQIQALPRLLTEIARAYHNFYANCQVLSDDKKLTKSRLLLILAVRNVLKISLTLIGISAPEKM